MPHRPRFDPKRPLVTARAFRFLGRDYAVGDPFPHSDDAAKVSERQRAGQYGSRAVNMGEAAPAEPVQMKATGNGGRYEITAPWLEEPVKVRGKKKANKLLDEMRADGAPLGWIEGGSEVTVEEAGGGWYEVNAPWLEEAEKVQGREDAEKRQREIHAAGAPEEADAGEGTGEQGGENPAGASEGGDGENGDPDNAGSEKEGNDGDGGDAGAGEPDGDKNAADGENGDGAGEDPSEDGEGAQDAQAADVDALVTATHTGGGYYEVKAPWLTDVEKVRGKADAEAARRKLVEAGPPEGWSPASA